MRNLLVAVLTLLYFTIQFYLNRRFPFTLGLSGIGFYIAYRLGGEYAWTGPTRAADAAETHFGLCTDEDLLRAAVFAHQLASEATRSDGRRARQLMRRCVAYLEYPTILSIRGQPHALLGRLKGNRMQRPSGKTVRGSYAIAGYMMREAPSTLATIRRQLIDFIGTVKDHSECASVVCELTLRWSGLVHTMYEQSDGHGPSIASIASDLVRRLHRAYETFEMPAATPPVVRWPHVTLSVGLGSLIVLGVVVYATGWDRTPDSALALLGLAGTFVFGVIALYYRVRPAPNVQGAAPIATNLEATNGANQDSNGHLSLE